MLKWVHFGLGKDTVVVFFSNLRIDGYVYDDSFRCICPESLSVECVESFFAFDSY